MEIAIEIMAITVLIAEVSNESPTLMANPLRSTSPERQKLNTPGIVLVAATTNNKRVNYNLVFLT